MAFEMFKWGEAEKPKVEKSVSSPEDLLRRAEMLSQNTDPSIAEKRNELFVRYADKLSRPLAAYAAALALSFSATVQAQGEETYPGNSWKSQVTEPAKSEKREVKKEEVPNVEAKKDERKVAPAVNTIDYRAMSREQRATLFERHKAVMEQAVKEKNENAFYFHIGELRKITETNEDAAERERVLDKLDTYQSMAKFHFFMSRNFDFSKN